MDLEQEVRAVMHQSPEALAVDRVARLVTQRIKNDIRSVLNTLAKSGELEFNRGGGHATYYQAPPLTRRV